MHTNLFNIVLSAIFLTIGSAKIYSQELPKSTPEIPIQKASDSIIITPDLVKIADTVKTDTIKPKPLLSDKIKYKAENYTKIDQKKKLITLYDKAELYYQDIELTAGIIVMDYEKDEVYAGRIKDTTGQYTQYPTFKQGENVVEPDSIRFNYKTKKALV
ncbi:MAG TPA: LPS-assembly protein LptD, partial [Flavobacterium sp.]